MNHPELSVLIPAAGASNRLGQAKQLLQYHGKTLIQRAVDTALSLAPGEIVVITGAKAQAVEDAVQQFQVRLIHNPQWIQGMGSAIALGAGAINPESTGMLILLCDQWRIRAQDLQDLAAAWQSDPGRIVCAKADGHYMPPVIFPASCFIELQGLKGEQGARKLFKTRPQLLHAIVMENAASDLDTPTQLESMNA